MHRTIEVTIDPTGSVTIEATGFRGGACEQATKEIEEALGLKKARKKKPEYYAIGTTVLIRSQCQSKATPCKVYFLADFGIISARYTVEITVAGQSKGRKKTPLWRPVRYTGEQ